MLKRYPEPATWGEARATLESNTFGGGAIPTSAATFRIALRFVSTPFLPLPKYPHGRHLWTASRGDERGDRGTRTDGVRWEDKGWEYVAWKWWWVVGPADWEEVVRNERLRTRCARPLPDGYPPPSGLALWVGHPSPPASYRLNWSPLPSFFPPYN